jgi:excisionase family DNA binding protein
MGLAQYKTVPIRPTLPPDPPPASDPEIMTADEVAAYLRIHPRTVTDRARRGEIPGRRIGNLWRFSRKAITALI